MRLKPPISAGNTADIYLHDGNIVKMYSRHSKQTVELEATKQAYAKSLGLPVPAVLEVTEVGDRPALVMERAPGVPMKELIFEQPEQMQEFLTRSVEVQQMVHDKTAPNLRSMSDRLREQIDSVNQLNGAQKLRLIAMLEDIDDETQLCHGDFHVQNLIVDGDDVSIIDWMDATRGDVRLDVCRSYVIYSEVDTDFADAYLAEYCRQSGLQQEEVLRWEPVIAGARLSE